MSGKGKRKKTAGKRRGADVKKSEREERLAEALRDNLHRRKGKGGGHRPSPDSHTPGAKAFTRKSTRGR